MTQGKVFYVGVSEWSAVQIADAVYLARELNLDRIVSNQPIYNMLTRYIERDIVPLCVRAGIGQIVFSPLAQGVLTGKYRPGQAPAQGTRAADPETGKFIRNLLRDETLAAVQRLQEVAQEVGCTMAQLALAWVLRQPSVSSAITGASRPQQVEENVAAADTTLSDDVLCRIEEVLAGVVSYDH